MRKQLNYEWHWFWATGNGEIGNNGVHVLDLCRWALGQDQAPPRAMSIGGRFGFHDCGQTANTQIAILDYHPAPVICEIRNLHAAGTSDSVGKFRGRTGGLVIDCEGGYFSGDASGGALFDKAGHKIRDLSDEGEGRQLEALHLANFAAAIRSRKTGDLAANIREGHLSAACCHLPNLSHRLGKGAAPQAILETVRADAELLDAFERCREYLQANGVDLNATPAALGPWIGYDSRRESFVGPFAEQANALSRREDRVPYTVPALV